jgi:uncharacterized protein (DUF433 family)
MNPLLARITIDAAISHGKPCVRGLRYPVEMLLDLLSAGMTTDDILNDYEDLERDDLLAVLAFAARLSRTKQLQPVNPATETQTMQGVHGMALLCFAGSIDKPEKELMSQAIEAGCERIENGLAVQRD